eukprot:TRINITY_DN8271_c0_g1_i1.p1 TRINITY_DN8271_c0_g1~~TRINITY_DN8271_c0_g1_i1.p1  ORF type:complete len:201 (+),score=98.96 TRINITY_DN8271_c0_g1_i1:92-694(+)
MKLLSIILFKWVANGLPIQLTSAYDLSPFGFFQRGSVKEVALFVSREVVQRSKPGDRHSVLHKEHFCHVMIRGENLACAVLSDEDYPQRVIFSLINTAFDEFDKAVPESQWINLTTDASFNVASLEPLLLKFQNPEEADKIMKIQKDLDETKDILIKSIDQLLDRGEKLENLAKQSQDLSFQSKIFLDRSTEMNSCCIIL